ncbi:hypothetical protein llap_2539 [Limosa lapponica baueri]|uniref:Uncharacterized protein n=1 Tax=Limosa lapponica baueri TaxID=1758121 RepID=A0A2I0UM87_LIMLA|nr:hypothetical protein llap_2539 [Limosa lapponica baueri]
MEERSYSKVSIIKDVKPVSSFQDDDLVTSRHWKSPKLDSVMDGNWIMDLDSGMHRSGSKADEQSPRQMLAIEERD